MIPATIPKAIVLPIAGRPIIVKVRAASVPSLGVGEMVGIFEDDSDGACVS